MSLEDLEPDKESEAKSTSIHKKAKVVINPNHSKEMEVEDGGKEVVGEYLQDSSLGGAVRKGKNDCKHNQGAVSFDYENQDSHVIYPKGTDSSLELYPEGVNGSIEFDPDGIQADLTRDVKNAINEVDDGSIAWSVE